MRRYWAVSPCLNGVLLPLKTSRVTYSDESAQATLYHFPGTQASLRPTTPHSIDMSSPGGQVGQQPTGTPSMTELISRIESLDLATREPRPPTSASVRTMTLVDKPLANLRKRQRQSTAGKDAVINLADEELPDILPYINKRALSNLGELEHNVYVRLRNTTRVGVNSILSIQFQFQFRYFQFQFQFQFHYSQKVSIPIPIPIPIPEISIPIPIPEISNPGNINSGNDLWCHLWNWL